MNDKSLRDEARLHKEVESEQLKWEVSHGGIKMHTLKYDAYLKHGIFGHFQFAEDHVPFANTLSHAYPVGGTYQPIVMPGNYTCVRGMHKLQDGIPFETFEIIGIAGHSGLLFHPLNFNKDSHGCTGLGASRVRYDSNKDGVTNELDEEMITSSRKTFAAWMARLDGVDSFTLQVL